MIPAYGCPSVGLRTSACCKDCTGASGAYPPHLHRISWCVGEIERKLGRIDLRFNQLAEVAQALLPNSQLKHTNIIKPYTR